MNDTQKNEVRLKLVCAQNALRLVKQLAAVKEAQVHIDAAISTLFADRLYDYEPPVKKPIELHSDVELLAEIQKRLLMRQGPHGPATA